MVVEEFYYAAAAIVGCRRRWLGEFAWASQETAPTCL